MSLQCDFAFICREPFFSPDVAPIIDFDAGIGEAMFDISPSNTLGVTIEKLSCSDDFGFLVSVPTSVAG